MYNVHEEEGVSMTIAVLAVQEHLQSMRRSWMNWVSHGLN